MRNAPYDFRPIFTVPFVGIQRVYDPRDREEYMVAILHETAQQEGFQDIYIFSSLRVTHAQTGFKVHFRVPVGYTLHTPCDWDRDGAPEIPFFVVENKQAALVSYTLDGRRKARVDLEPLSIPYPSDQLDRDITAFVDLDGDGRMEMVWRMSAEFWGLPRGIAVHDPHSGRKRWEYLMGAVPTQVIPQDNDRDGKPEILFTAWASHNGIRCNGLDDDTTYLGLLDGRGKPRWLHETGGFFSRTYAAPFTAPDGRPLAVTTRSCHRAIAPDPAELAVYDLRSGRRERSLMFPELSFNDIWSGDWDSDGKTDFLFADNTGGIYLYGADFTLKHKRQFAQAASIFGAFAATGGHGSVVFAKDGNSTVRLLDSRLRPVAEYTTKYDFPGFNPIIPLGTVDQPVYMMNLDRPILVTPRRGGLAAMVRTLPPRMVVDAIVLAVLWSLFAVLWKREEANARLHMEIQRLSAGGDWQELAQELLHRMKTPMTSMVWEIDRLKQEMAAREMAGEWRDFIAAMIHSLGDDLNELKAMNRFLMKLLQIRRQNLRRQDVKALLQGVVDKYDRVCQGRYRFTFTAPAGEVFGRIDEEQMREALDNVVENAVDAQPTGGEVRVSLDTRRGASGTELVITVADKGAGIAQEEMEKIFTPYYSTKKEGFGIGLSLVRRILEAHGGRVEISSTVGVGTEVALIIGVDKQGA